MADESRQYGSSYPMRGVVLCCTSIPPDERDTYAEQARMMGGSHEANLIAQTTHLIVGQVGTAKYNFAAKERPDIRVIAPSFVPAVRDLWVAGDEFDLEDLEKEHALPAFWSCKICLTGLEVLEDRHKIQQLIVENGGEYHADLTKEVTHLLTWQPQGKKYQYALQWKIKTVGFEWLYQSIERGMILDEDLFLPTLPVEQRGVGSWKRRDSHSLGKRSRTESQEATTGAVGAGPRKLRRIASVKLGSQNAAIWKDIANGSGVEKKKAGGDWDEIEDDRESKVGMLEIETKSELPKSKPQGIFSGYQFFTCGFDQKQTSAVVAALTSHGGEVRQTSDACEPSEGPSYIILRHTHKIADCRDSYPLHDDSQYATEWWIEQCLESKKLLSPQDSILWRPFSAWPLKSFEGKVISSTGFQGLELLHISKLISLMGAKYDEFLTASSDLLICKNAGRSDKLLGAWDWDVVSVLADWLWDSVKIGSAQNISRYALTKPAAKKEEKSSVESLPITQAGTGSQVAIRTKDSSCLNGFVIFISSSLEDKRTKIASFARSLGATVAGSLDSRPTVTHCLARSAAPLNVQLKQAQSLQGCHIVSVKWLNACAQKGLRVNENEFRLDFSAGSSAAEGNALPALDSNSTHTLANESVESLKSLPKPGKGSTPLEDLPPPGPNTSKPSSNLEKVTGTVHATIAQMVKQLASSTSSSAAGPGSTTGSGPAMEPLLWRKTLAGKERRLLGRATSASSSMGQLEPDLNRSQSLQPEIPLEEIPVQSQALEYLDPDAAAVRERILRRVNGQTAQKPNLHPVPTTAAAVNLSGPGRNLRRRD